MLHLNGELRIEVSTEKQLPNSLKSTPCINPENTSGGTDETDTHLNLTETVSKCFSLKHLRENYLYILILPHLLLTLRLMYVFILQCHYV